MADEPVVIKGVASAVVTTATVGSGGSRGQGAVLCSVPGYPPGTIWVPQSVIHADSEVYAAHQNGKLVIARWWAVKKGLDKYEA